jgi:hypothetical protein
VKVWKKRQLTTRGATRKASQRNKAECTAKPMPVKEMYDFDWHPTLRRIDLMFFNDHWQMRLMFLPHFSITIL